MPEKIDFDTSKTAQWLLANGFGQPEGDEQDVEALADSLERLAAHQFSSALALSVASTSLHAEAHRLQALCFSAGLPEGSFSVEGSYYPAEDLAVLYLYGVDDARLPDVLKGL